MIEQEIQVDDLKRELVKRMEKRQQKGKDKILPM